MDSFSKIGFSVRAIQDVPCIVFYYFASTLYWETSEIINSNLRYAYLVLDMPIKAVPCLIWDKFNTALELNPIRTYLQQNHYSIRIIMI